MSRYYSFNDFMTDVVSAANKVCEEKRGGSLQDYAKISKNVYVGILKLIAESWAVYSGVVDFLSANIGKVLLFGAIAAFLLTPMGLVVAAVLGAAAAKIIMAMYHDKVLTPAVRKTGEMFKDRWEEMEGYKEDIDALLEEAVYFLLRNVGVI